MLWLSSCWLGHVLRSHHHSDKMAQRSQVSGAALWGCSLNVFVFLLVRCLLITPIACLYISVFCLFVCLFVSFFWGGGHMLTCHPLVDHWWWSLVQAGFYCTPFILISLSDMATRKDSMSKWWDTLMSELLMAEIVDTMNMISAGNPTIQEVLSPATNSPEGTKNFISSFIEEFPTPKQNHHEK